MSETARTEEIKAYVSANEHETVKRNAVQARQSMSEYLRNLLLNEPLAPVSDIEAVDTVVQTSEQLAQQGKNLKAGLDNDIDDATVKAICQGIAANLELLTKEIEKL